jgi:AcrR family transcriptional regulator
VDAALSLFAERGFHATSVDDIAGSVGISRAALYQYFESKEQLFVALLYECGAALMRVVRRLGPLGPTAEGYDNLHWWLGEWAWVYDKYSTMFVEWANVDSPRAPLRPLISRWVEAYSDRVVQRLKSSGVNGIDPDAVAVALLAVLNRTNYWRHTTEVRGLSDEVILDTMATVVQLVIFPTTPAEAMVLPRSAAGRSQSGNRTSSGDRRRGDRTAGETLGRPRPERFGGMSERVQGTISRLLDAGAEVFAAQGYHSGSIDDIVRAAGLGRGTFYKYFDDKLGLLIVLADECAERLRVLASSFAEIYPDRRGSDIVLRAWLDDFLSFHRRYTGVFQVWQSGTPSDASLHRMGQRTGAAMLASFDTVLARVNRSYHFDITAGSLVLFALVENLPDQVPLTSQDPSSDRQVQILAAVIERGLFNRPPLAASA